ncbi:MAG: hypothetical protein SFY68_16015 [Candidatus Sumerlaeia bacterium]|nr:hypothetical protein [Candidatus Sumerlaeia bacterium]
MVFPLEWAQSGALLVYLSTLFAIVLLLLLYFICRSYLREDHRCWAILAPTFFVVSDLNVLVAGQSGMETALSSCLLVAYYGILGKILCSESIDSASLRLGNRLAFGLGLLGFLLVLARPEFGLIASLCPLFLWIKYLKDRDNRTQFVFLWGIITAILLVLYGMIRIYYFGELFPQSFKIKGTIWNSPYKDFDPDELRNLGNYWILFLRESWFLHLAVAFLLSQKQLWRSYFWLWFPIYLGIFYLSTSLQIMGYLHRYFFPFSCGMMVLLFSLVCKLNCDSGSYWISRHSFNRGYFWVMLVYIFSVILLPQAQLRSYQRTFQSVDYRVSWLLNPLPEGTKIVMTELGVGAARNPHLEFIDITGLNDPEFAGQFDAASLFNRQPDVITLVHHHYRGMTRDIVRHPRFGEFEPLRSLNYAEPMNKLDNRIFVWKKSPRYKEIRRALLTAAEPIVE